MLRILTTGSFLPFGPRTDLIVACRFADFTKEGPGDEVDESEDCGNENGCECILVEYNMDGTRL